MQLLKVCFSECRQMSENQGAQCLDFAFWSFVWEPYFRYRFYDYSFLYKKRMGREVESVMRRVVHSQPCSCGETAVPRSSIYFFSLQLDDILCIASTPKHLLEFIDGG